MSPQSLRLAKISLNFESDLLHGSFTHGREMLALVYGSIGVLIGPIFGRVSGVFMAFVIPFLDISISQSPMLRAQPEAWAQFLPGYGGVRLLLDGVATAGFDETRGLALAAAWALAALAAAAWLIYASTGGNDGRRGREARFG